jgi:hypothetical protein
MNKGELIIYTTEDGHVSLQLRVEDGTAWLSQLELSELFQTSKQNVSLHIKNVLDDGELAEDSVVKEYLTTAVDGKKYRVKYFNLDMILAVGYRVRSPRGIQFRQWATSNLREYLVKEKPKLPNSSSRKFRTRCSSSSFHKYAYILSETQIEFFPAEWHRCLVDFSNPFEYPLLQFLLGSYADMAQERSRHL